YLSFELALRHGVYHYRKRGHRQIGFFAEMDCGTKFHAEMKTETNTEWRCNQTFTKEPSARRNLISAVHRSRQTQVGHQKNPRMGIDTNSTVTTRMLQFGCRSVESQVQKQNGGGDEKKFVCIRFLGPHRIAFCFIGTGRRT